MGLLSDPACTWGGPHSHSVFHGFLLVSCPDPPEVEEGLVFSMNFLVTYSVSALESLSSNQIAALALPQLAILLVSLMYWNEN